MIDQSLHWQASRGWQATKRDRRDGIVKPADPDALLSAMLLLSVGAAGRSKCTEKGPRQWPGLLRGNEPVLIPMYA
jgi:hypothetical protein